MKDDGVNKDDAEFKQAIHELKIRKKTLEEQVESFELLVRVQFEFNLD